MNVRVVDTANSVSSWFKTMARKINRAFIRIGTARAAAELSRQGYYKEAQALMQQREN